VKIVLSPLTNSEAIRRLCERSGEWEAMRADGEPLIDGVPWSLVTMNPRRSAWLGVWSDSRLVGAFLFINLGDGIAEVHTLMTRECRGKAAVQAGKEALLWVFHHRVFLDESPDEIITNCPEPNRAASYYAAAVGLNYQGRHPMAWVKHGKAHDLLQWGIHKFEL